jgi:PAS domain S-box-containing protein
MDNLATIEERILGHNVKNGDHSSTIKKYSSESAEVKKPDVKDLVAENIRFKAEIADAKKKQIDLSRWKWTRRPEIEAIFDSAPIGLCVLDRNLRYVCLNKRFAEINGESVEKHIGKTPRQIVPDLSEQAEEAMRKVLETGDPLLNFEVSGITSAQPGVRRYWNENWLPLKDRQGKIVGVSITAEEITERKLAEEGLRREKQQLEERTRELEETNLLLRRSEEKFNKAFHSSPA